MNIYEGENINKHAKEIKELFEKAGKDKYSQEWLEVDIRNILHKVIVETRDNVILLTKNDL